MRTWGRIISLLILVSLLGVLGAAAQEGGDPERGGVLFVENCAVCHGVDGRGRAGATLQSFSGINVDAAVRETVLSGVPGSQMPAWGRIQGGPLSEQDVDDIVAYIIGIFDGTEPIQPLPEYIPPVIPPIANVVGDPSQGAVVYQANCVMCHGDQGQGRFGVALAQSWPGNQPQLYIRQVVADGVDGATMPAFAAAAGGPLDEQEIADVSAYLLSFTPLAGIPTPAAPEGPLNLQTSLLLGVLVLLLLGLGLIFYYRRA